MIEEPPPRSLILIVAHRPGQVLATIRSRCRKLMLEPLTPAEIEEVDSSPRGALERGGRRRIAAEARALGRLGARDVAPARSRGAGGRGADRCGDRRPAAPRPELQLRLAEAVNGRAAEDAFERFTLAIFDWLAAEAHKPSSPARLEAIAGLWRKLSDQTRETLALNLDKRLHVIALFDEIVCARRR